MKLSGIYKIQSIIKPERIYVGSSKCISQRWHYHLLDLRKNKHHSKKLQRHYNKYGESDIQFSVLLGCEIIDLLKTEQYFLDSYKPYFNNSLTAGSNLGLKRGTSWNKGIKTGLTPKTAFKKGQSPWNKGLKLDKEPWNKGTKGIMKAWNKGKKYHFHNKRDNSIYKGRKVSEETKQKLRVKAIGRKLPDWAVKNISRRLMGNKNMLGKPRSEETKKRVSEGLKKYYIQKNINEMNLITKN
jgi:group I intron endonuclease